APADEDRPVLRAVGWLTAGLLAVGGLAAPAVARTFPVPIGSRLLLAAAGLAWGTTLAMTMRRDRPHAVPTVLLGALLTPCALPALSHSHSTTLSPPALRPPPPAVSALRSDYDIARLIAGQDRAPVVSLSYRAPSLVFYLQAPVIHTEELQVVRDLFAGDGL